MYQNETPWTNQSWYNALWSEPKFIAVPKHKKVASSTKLCLPDLGYRSKYHVTCTVFDWFPASFVLNAELVSNIVSF